MAQRRKSIRRKSFRHKNRTTLKRGGVKEQPTSGKSKGIRHPTPNVFKNKKHPNNTPPLPPLPERCPDSQAAMSPETIARIKREIDMLAKDLTRSDKKYTK